MKNLHAFLLLSVMSPWAWGQVGAPPDAQSMDAALSRIATQRQQETQVFDQEERACLSRFAVTACQNDVAKRRRSMLADLRRQELVRKEAARKEATRAHLEHLKVKTAENATREAERVPTAAAPTRQPTEPKNARHPAPPIPPQATVSPKANAIEALDPAILAERRRAYEAKQEELVRRRQERDKRLQTPSKQGLPTPP
jgi:colicin import membrane protein